ncbi:lipocalin family protein [Acinetobacter junii]|uniref:lipocalin family protein n=1 Tax=Acinetobacter junii TaxID=40215 RepID=UPI00190236DE|nr:lipocalin family protein [Acinetobacter junii]MBJ8440129.1 lipocalin family protein [Acinetobacter junii]
MKVKTLLSLSVLSISLSTLSFPTFANTPKAVDKIDINQYVGKWYEIAHLPMYFQRQCVSDTSAKYAIKADNTISVLNSCRTAAGEMKSSEGVAYPQNQGKSQLKVSFLPKGLRWLPFTKGDYWVLRVDPDYKVALVGGPSTKYLWILSKTPTIDEATYQSYLQTAKQQGYDLSNLIKTTHTSP